MEVVRHADEQIEPGVLLNALRESVEETLAVGIIFEQPGLLRASILDHPARDVIDRSGKLYAQVSCHSYNIAELLTACKVYCEWMTSASNG